jgi:hypothetical protein
MSDTLAIPISLYWSANLPQTLIDLLSQSSSKADVRKLINDHGYDEVNKAWFELDALQRSALELVRSFDGTIVHEPRSESDPI